MLLVMGGSLEELSVAVIGATRDAAYVLGQTAPARMAAIRFGGPVHVPRKML